MQARALKSAAMLAATMACFGCASGAAGGGGGGTGNVLTYEQLVETGETTVYGAIDRLRSRWLRPRGQATVTGQSAVTLFVDGSPRGDVSTLRSMGIETVRDVTYLSASEAAFQFGTIAGNSGTIAVRTRR